MARLIGGDPFEIYSEGRLKGLHRHPMICIYPSLLLVVTGPGTHGDCHARLVELAGELGLNPADSEHWRQEYVAGVARDGNILLRDDGHPMAHVFRAAEILEGLFPEKMRQIRYLGVSDERVRTAVRRHGELWRINPPAQTKKEMLKVLQDSKITIGTEAIYYYNPRTGTRYLTEGSARELLALPPERQQACAAEINHYSARANKKGNPELKGFNTTQLVTGDLKEILAGFETYRVDEATAEDQSPSWINALFECISSILPGEEEFLGLSPELKMKIHWMPGGRVEPGHGVVFHPCVTERVEGIIRNLHEARRNASFINLGSVIETNSRRRVSEGRREVYVVEAGLEHGTEVFIVRMQDWDTWHYLEGCAQGHPNPTVEQAEALAEEYARYRFLTADFAKNLGVNKQDTIPQRIKETYQGKLQHLQGSRILAHYSIRRYVYGMATDKIPANVLKRRPFAVAAASLLGKAAAANMVVGRANPEGQVLFNDGDEYLILRDDIPVEIRIGDVTGCLTDFESSFAAMRQAYETRVERLFALGLEYRKIFVESMVQHYAAIRDRVRENPKRFRSYLDLNIRQGVDIRMLSLHYERGSFRFRAAEVLKRLENTTPEELRALWA